MLLRTSCLALAALVFLPGAALAAKSYDNCTGFIDSLPATITTQGTWCLRKDLATGMTSGAAIDVAANNVVIDCNDFKIGNLSAGLSTSTSGVYTGSMTNVTVRNCNIRGFRIAVEMVGYSPNATVEFNNIQGATHAGIIVAGRGSLIRGNVVSDIGGTTVGTDFPRGIFAAEPVDVLDNTVSGVVGTSGATGIQMSSSSHGASVSGNRVRGVETLSSGQVIGIRIDGSPKLSLRNNQVTSYSAAEAGLKCGGAEARARGNTIAGFATAIAQCGDAGGNDLSP